MENLQYRLQLKISASISPRPGPEGLAPLNLNELIICNTSEGGKLEHKERLGNKLKGITREHQMSSI